MVDCRRYNKNKNCMNHNSKNGLLLIIIIYTVALICESHSTSMETESYDARCSDALTCIECTIKYQCVWSLQQQVCFYHSAHLFLRYMDFYPSYLTIYSKEKCPRFSVVTKRTYSNNTLNNLQYIVNVSNDKVGFMHFLKESIFSCNSTTIDVYKKRISGDQIKCSAKILKNEFKQNNQSFTALISIQLNDVLLRLDNIADHYVTFYEHECEEHKKNEFCATCAWNEKGIPHYVRLCSSDNSCEGHNELYVWHNDKGQSWHPTTQKIKDQCAEIKVTAVDPLSGTMAAGTVIRITVKNHFIFAENRNVTVTVAGTACANPRTTGPDTITCVTTPSPDDAYEPRAGPILVKYTSDKMHELNIESSQIFQFCLNPKLDSGQRLGGIVAGGTSVVVRGRHFVRPCTVSSVGLYVDLPVGIRSYAEGYCDPPVNDTYMVCRSPRVQLAGLDGNTSVVGFNFGLFITSLEIMVSDSYLKFYVYPDPKLLDFEINVSGIVVVNGLNLQHLLLDDIVVRSMHFPSEIFKVMSVTRHSLLCKSILPVNALQEISVTFGKSLRFTVFRRTSPDHDDPLILHEWSLLIMFMVMMFVCAITICRGTKHQKYVKLNIHKPPEESIRSQDI